MAQANVQPPTPQVLSLLSRVADAARRADVFGEVKIDGGSLSCAARAAAAPAWHRVEFDGSRIWVSLVTPDRWLSQSIEADLVHTGDKLEDLIDEELVEQGFSAGPLPCEHFRSDDRLFTFRSAVPIQAAAIDSLDAARLVSHCLLAYEAAFRELGDMSAGDDEE